MCVCVWGGGGGGGGGGGRIMKLIPSLHDVPKLTVQVMLVPEVTIAIFRKSDHAEKYKISN